MSERVSNGEGVSVECGVQDGGRGGGGRRRRRGRCDRRRVVQQHGGRTVVLAVQAGVPAVQKVAGTWMCLCSPCLQSATSYT